MGYSTMSEIIFNKKTTSLISLLEDENSEVAASAMLELLSYKKELRIIISEFQESSNPFLRKRIHQLQSIVTTRKNRENLSRKFSNIHSGLWQGLCELHILWYDNDTLTTLKTLQKDLFLQASIYKPNTTYKISNFMKTMQFETSIKGHIEPDYYCVGSVIETKIGADFLLCSIAFTIASLYGWDGCIAHSKKGYILIDNENRKILPNKWNIVKIQNSDEYKKCSTGMILKNTAFHLLLYAINSNSIRYIHSIGLCMANMLGTKNINDLLPYPYNGIVQLEE